MIGSLECGCESDDLVDLHDTGACNESCRVKHARIATDPVQRHRKPVTSAMEVGWPRSWELRAPANGKVKCKETAIAEAQILGPRYMDVISPATKMHF
jgi:hypothetical protein